MGLVHWTTASEHRREEDDYLRCAVVTGSDVPGRLFVWYFQPPSSKPKTFSLSLCNYMHYYQSQHTISSQFLQRILNFTRKQQFSAFIKSLMKSSACFRTRRDLCGMISVIWNISFLHYCNWSICVFSKLYTHKITVGEYLLIN